MILILVRRLLAVPGLEYESFLKGVIDMIDKKDPLITKACSDSLNYEYFQKQNSWHNG